MTPSQTMHTIDTLAAHAAYFRDHLAYGDVPTTLAEAKAALTFWEHSEDPEAGVLHVFYQLVVSLLEDLTP